MSAAEHSVLSAAGAATMEEEEEDEEEGVSIVNSLFRLVPHVTASDFHL